MKYEINQEVCYEGQTGLVKLTKPVGETFHYYCQFGPISMWVTEDELNHGRVNGINFQPRYPHLLIVDDFYSNPDKIRELALIQDYEANLRQFKGKRTKERFLFPYIKEEFERLLGAEISDWLDQPCNGCFQMTGYNDPLVWHSDRQSYAAAIYLTPHAPVTAGTSFWRNKDYGVRRPPTHALENSKFPIDEINQITNNVYSEFNLLNQDNWELVDKVGAIYNRLAIWDAKLIHSASSYEGLESDLIDKSRLVQLFFFTINEN